VLVVRSEGPGDTQALGGVLADLLRPGDLVLLVGDVGAGKTTLVRAVAAALGVTGPVTSPTFTLANRYDARVPLLHIDAYRLGSPDDEELGLLLDDADRHVTFIEWPQALGDHASAPRIAVAIEHQGGDRRLITLSSPAADVDLEQLGDDLRARHVDAQPGPGAGAG